MISEPRHIVHMDLDTFFVSVERLNNSALVGKPVIIGGLSDRGVVASCSYEARHFGVRSAMPMRTARQLCPDASIIRGDMEAYSQYSHMVTDIVAERVPLYEKSSIDEFYLDLSGMDRFFGCLSYSDELRSAITRETGLPISFGLSENKTVSKIGTGEAKPNGRIHILRGTEKGFLAPLSIARIPMIGEVTFRLLRGMGIATISTLQHMPPELLERVLGKNGVVIWKKANGIDRSPVVPYSERKSISTEHTFDSDTIDVAGIRAMLSGMVEGLAFRLRKSQKLTACITVKIRYANFDTETRQMRIPYTSADHVLLTCAQELFGKLYTRRMLIRLVGVRLSHLVNGSHQIDLFGDTEKMVDLYQAMDRIRIRFGEDAVKRAMGMRE
jgi:DNA polymerase IV